jgi:hypothetical protein
MINLIYSLQCLREPGWRWVRCSVPAGSRIFHFSIALRLALRPTQPPQWVPGCGAHHSPPTSALVKKTCIYTPWLHTAQLVKHKENFTLVLRLFWFSWIPSLVIPRQMLGQYLDIMLQPLSSTSFLMHNSLSYHSALFVYWCCQWLGLQHLMENLSQDKSVFQPRFEQSVEHKSSLSQLAWWLYMYCPSY